MGYYLGPKLQKDLFQSIQDRDLSLAIGKIKLPSFQSIGQFTDLCKVYKIQNGYYKIEENKFFNFSNTRMKQHFKMVAISIFV